MRKRRKDTINHIVISKIDALTNRYKSTIYPCINDKKRLINESKRLSTD